MKPSRLALLACLTLCVSTATAQTAAVMIAMPLPTRVAPTDLIVIGKVTGFADKAESVLPYPGAPKAMDYQIAIVKVDETLLGKGVKEVRVGFIANTGTVRPGIGRRLGFTLTNGQEACLLLVKHPVGDFYTGQAAQDAINKVGNTNFEKQVAEIKKCAKLLADPKAGLDSKSADDRLLTAAMLVAKYRAYRPSATAPKQEPIDAAESKKILTILADAEWADKVAFDQVQPQRVFSQLGLQAADGWTPPRDAAMFKEAAKKWLKDNADKYRIQRNVFEMKKDAKKPAPTFVK